MQPNWEGFGVRLRRAIDRWPGGGQRAFMDELRSFAERNELRIPTSYRTLVNYLNKKTRPTEAWVDAAATVLRWRSENLLTGEGPERADDDHPRLKIRVSEDAGPRTSTLTRLVLNRYIDLPMSARLMMVNFLDDYFAGDFEGWTYEAPCTRDHDVRRVLADYFAPLLAAPTMRHAEIMALASSLTAAAYVRLGAADGSGKRETEG